ncbi:MAG: hypothetical protein AABX51_02855 [Nanoarchaeota archaeon]
MVGDIVSWIDRNVTDPSVHQALEEYDELIKKESGKEYLLNTTRLWRDIGRDIRSAPTRLFVESDLEKIIRNMMPAAVLGTVMHYGEKRKDKKTDYIEHPAGVARGAVMACLYDEDALPDFLVKIARRAGKNSNYRKGLLKIARIESKLCPIHDTSESWKKKNNETREAGVAHVMERYAKLNPDDPDMAILQELQHHITPTGGHFFRDIDEIVGIESKRSKAYLYIAKAHDRIYNTQDNEYLFDLDNRIDNLIKNLYVANTIKQFLIDNDPRSNVRQLPFGIKLPFDIPFSSPDVPVWYFPLLQSYNDLVLTSEIECRHIASDVLPKMSKYAATLNSPRGRKQGLSGRKFKQMMGSLMSEVDDILGGKNSPTYLQVTDDRRTAEGRVREMQQLTGVVLSNSKMPAEERLKKVLYDGVYSVFGQLVTTPFDSSSSEARETVSPDFKMAHLVINYSDAKFLLNTFRHLRYETGEYIRNLDKAA